MDLLELLAQRPLVVADGAMGTALMDLGLPPGACADLWNLQNPTAVEQVQRQYVEAGADFLLTNTFGGNGVALGRHGLDGKLEQINAAGVEIARRAAGDGALVVGDVSSTGRLLEPLGDLSEQDAANAFRRQAAALAEAGVDAFICETFESVVELRLALQAVRGSSDVPLIASMTFRPEPGDRFRSMMGEGPEDLVRVAEEFGCEVIGTNCGQGSATMPPLVGQIADLVQPGTPVIAKPNAGVPRLVNGRAVYDEGPDVFAAVVPELYRRGARVIGGCDGATPEHVAVVRRFADSL